MHIYIFFLESSPKSNTRGARVKDDILPAVQQAKKLNYTFSSQISMGRRLHKNRVHILLISFTMCGHGGMMSVYEFLINTISRHTSTAHVRVI